MTPEPNEALYWFRCSVMQSKDMEGTKPPTREFDAAAIGALAHLYRGEVYRSTIWRTRLDKTTNCRLLCNSL